MQLAIADPFAFLDAGHLAQLVQMLGLDAPAGFFGQFARQGAGRILVVFDTTAKKIPGPAIVDRSGTLAEQKLAGGRAINDCPGSAFGRSMFRTSLWHMVV